MFEFCRQRAELILDQPVLKRAKPCGIYQRFGQVFVHFTVPIGEQIQRNLTFTLRCAVRSRLSGEPQISTDERQKCARGEADRVELRFHKTVTGMHLARLHQALPTLHTLAVAPFITHMHRERAFDNLVIGIAKNTTNRLHKFRIGCDWKHTFPTVFSDPAGAGHAPFALVVHIALWHRTDEFQRDLVLVDECEVLRGRDIALCTDQCTLHIRGLHNPHSRAERRVARAECGPSKRGDMPLRRDRGEREIRAREHRPIVGPTQGQRDRHIVFDVDYRLARFKRLEPIWCAIFFRVVRVELLDEHVLIIKV